MSLISYVFIETQVFYTNNYDYQRTAFRELIARVKQNRIRVVLCSVTVGEVIRQVEEKVREAAVVVDDTKRGLRVLANSAQPEVAGRVKRLDVKTVVAELDAQFRDFLKESKAEVIDVSDVDAELVFEKYFRFELPFERKKEKRMEFPDAFAIEALRAYAKENDVDLTILTADKGFKAACEKYGMRTLNTVEEFLDAENRTREEKVSEHIINCYERQVEQIQSEIEDDFKNSAFHLVDVEGDVSSVSIDKIVLEDPLVVSIHETSATVEVSVQIEYSAEISYDDPDATVYDREDGRTYVFNTIEETIEETSEFSLEIEIDFDPEDEEHCGFRLGKLNDGQDFEVKSSY